MKKRALTTNTFFGGAAILAASIAVVKVIGALYKIPLGRILGTWASATSTTPTPSTTLLLMISQAGLPVAMSKTISEANALGRRNQVSRVFRVALTAFLVLGIASKPHHVPLCPAPGQPPGGQSGRLAVRVMALSCFFVCVMSAYRGYAQGHSDMVPTAVSQVLEALTKLIVGLFLAWYLLYPGFGREIFAAGAIGGVTASGLVALLYLMVRHHRRNSPAPAPGHRQAGGLRQDPEDPGGHCHPHHPQLLRGAHHHLFGHHPGPEPPPERPGLRRGAGGEPVRRCYQKAVTIYNLPSAFMVSPDGLHRPCRLRRPHQEGQSGGPGRSPSPPSGWGPCWPCRQVSA